MWGSSNQPDLPPRGWSLRERNGPAAEQYDAVFASLYRRLDEQDRAAREAAAEAQAAAPPPSPNTRMRMATTRGLPSLPTQPRLSIADTSGQGGGRNHFERRTSTRDEDEVRTPGDRGGLIRFGPRIDHESNPSPFPVPTHPPANHSSIRSSLDSSFNPPPLQALPSDHSLVGTTPGLLPSSIIAFGQSSNGTPQTDAARRQAQAEWYTPPDQIRHSRHDWPVRSGDTNDSWGARTASDLQPDGENTPTYSYHSSGPSNGNPTPGDQRITDLIGEIAITPHDQPNEVWLNTPGRDRPNHSAADTPADAADAGSDQILTVTPADALASHSVITTPAHAQTNQPAMATPAERESHAAAVAESPVQSLHTDRSEPDADDEADETDMESPPKGHFKYLSDIDRVRASRKGMSSFTFTATPADTESSPNVPFDPRSPPPANPALGDQAIAARLANTRAAAQGIHSRIFDALAADHEVQPGHGTVSALPDRPESGIKSLLGQSSSTTRAPAATRSSSETRPLLQPSAEDLAAGASSTSLERDNSSTTVASELTQVDQSGVSRQPSNDSRNEAMTAPASVTTISSRDKGKQKVRFPEPPAQAVSEHRQSGLRKLISFTHNRARAQSNDKSMTKSNSGDSLDRAAANEASYMNLESESSGLSLPRKASTKSFSRFFGKGNDSGQPAKEETETKYRVPRTPDKGKPLKRVPDPFRKLAPDENPLDSPVTTVVDEEEYKRQLEQKRRDSLIGSFKTQLKTAGASVKSLGTRRSNSAKDESVFISLPQDREISPTAAAGPSRKLTKAERLLGTDLHLPVTAAVAEQPLVEERTSEEAEAEDEPGELKPIVTADPEAQPRRTRMASAQSALTTTTSVADSSSRIENSASEAEILTAFIETLPIRGRSPATTRNPTGDSTPRGSDREQPLTEAQAIRQGYETIRNSRERRASLAPASPRTTPSPTRPPLQAITEADTRRIMAQAEERAPLSEKLMRQARSVQSLRTFRATQTSDLGKKPAQIPNLKSPSFASLRSIAKATRRVQSEYNIRRPKPKYDENWEVPAHRIRSPGQMGLSDELGLLGLDDPATHARYHRLPVHVPGSFAALRPFTQDLVSDQQTVSTTSDELSRARPQLVSRSSSSLLDSPATVRDLASAGIQGPAGPHSARETPTDAVRPNAPSPLASAPGQMARKTSTSSARQRAQSGPTNIHVLPRSLGWPTTPNAGGAQDGRNVTPGPTRPGESSQPAGSLMTPTIITTDEHDTPVLAHEGRLVSRPMGDPLRYPPTPGSATSSRNVSMTKATKWWDGKVEENPDLDLSARGPPVASAVVQAIRKSRSATQLDQPFGIGFTDMYDSLLPPCPAPLSVIAPHVVYWSPMLRREDVEGVGRYRSPAGSEGATHNWAPYALALSVVEDPTVSPNTVADESDNDLPKRIEAHLHLFSVAESDTTQNSPKIKRWPSFSTWFSKVKKAEKEPTSVRPTPPPLAELAKFALAEKERLTIDMYTFCRAFDPLVNNVGSRYNKSPSRPAPESDRVRWHDTDHAKCLLEVAFDAWPEAWIFQLPYPIRNLQNDWVTQIETQRIGAQARDLLLSSEQVLQIKMGMHAPRRPAPRDSIHDDIFGSRPTVPSSRRDSHHDEDHNGSNDSSPASAIRQYLQPSADRPGPDQGILKRNKSTTDLTHPTIPLAPPTLLQAPARRSLLQGATWWYMEQHIRSQNSEAFDWIRHSRYDTSSTAQAQGSGPSSDAQWGMVFGYPVSLDRVKLYWLSTVNRPLEPFSTAIEPEPSTSEAALPDMVHTFSRETTTTDLATNPSQQSNLSNLGLDSSLELPAADGILKTHDATNMPYEPTAMASDTEVTNSLIPTLSSKPTLEELQAAIAAAPHRRQEILDSLPKADWLPRKRSHPVLNPVTANEPVKTQSANQQDHGSAPPSSDTTAPQANTKPASTTPAPDQKDTQSSSGKKKHWYKRNKMAAQVDKDTGPSSAEAEATVGQDRQTKKRGYAQVFTPSPSDKADARSGKRLQKKHSQATIVPSNDLQTAKNRSTQQRASASPAPSPSPDSPGVSRAEMPDLVQLEDFRRSAAASRTRTASWRRPTPIPQTIPTATSTPGNGSRPLGEQDANKTGGDKPRPAIDTPEPSAAKTVITHLTGFTGLLPNLSGPEARQNRKAVRETEAEAIEAAARRQAALNPRFAGINTWTQEVAESFAFRPPDASIRAPDPTEGYGGEISLKAARDRHRVDTLIGMAETSGCESALLENTNEYIRKKNAELAAKVGATPATHKLITEPDSVHDPTFQAFLSTLVNSPGAPEWPDHLSNIERTAKAKTTDGSESYIIKALQEVWGKQPELFRMPSGFLDVSTCSSV